MKTKILSLILSIPLVFACVFSLAQAPANEDEECMQFRKIMMDASNYFDEYAGEETDYDGYLWYYDYELELWGDEGREYMVSDFDYFGMVAYYYCSTYNLEEARECYEKLLVKIKSCLPDNYFQSANESEYAIDYCEFSDNLDKDREYATSPVVEAGVYQEDDYYYVEIVFMSPEE